MCPCSIANLHSIVQARRALELWKSGESAKGKGEASKRALEFSEANWGLRSPYALWARQLLKNIRRLKAEQWDTILTAADVWRSNNLKAKRGATAPGEASTSQSSLMDDTQALEDADILV